MFFFILCFALAGQFFYQSPGNRETIRLSIIPPEATTFPTSSSAAPWPTVSPEGRRLVFSAITSEGKQILWLRSLGATTAQPLPGTENAVQPFWSPDGRFIAFFADGKLRKMDIEGGPPQAICDVPGTVREGTWNRDGVILFARLDNALFRVSSAGGQPAPITELDPTRQETGHLYPSFLPDGTHFLFLAQSTNPENSGLYVGSLASKERKLVLNVNSMARYSPPGYLLFVKDGTLVAQKFDAARLDLSGEAVPVAERVRHTPSSGIAAFSNSDTGVLVYSSLGLQSNKPPRLMWFDRSGKQLETVVAPAGYSFELSPDGKRLMLGQDEGPTNSSIWLLELSHLTLARLALASNDFFAIWSHDGSRIAFTSFREGGYVLFEKSTTGSGNEKVLLKSNVFIVPETWSPDGRSIVYVRLDPKTGADLWVLPLDGERKPVPFVETSFDEFQSQISPDGHWIAYASNDSGKYDVYVQSFSTGGSKIRISANGGLQPRWNPKGNELFYVAPDRKLMAVSIKTDPAFEIVSLKPLFDLESTSIVPGTHVSPSLGRQYSVGPDGQRFLVSLETEGSTSPITVVLNWSAALRK